MGRKNFDKNDLGILKRFLEPIDVALNNNESPKAIAEIILSLQRQQDIRDLQGRDKYSDLTEIFDIGKGLLERNGTQVNEVECLNRLRILVFLLYTSYLSE